MTSPTTDALLQVSNLAIDIKSPRGRGRVVDGVSFAVARGEVLGVVGESGCGKSITMLSLLGLLPDSADVAAGTVQFEGQNLLTLDRKALRQVRGARIGFVFQDPMTSLNPIMRIGAQLVETLIAHRNLSRPAAFEEAARLLAAVGIADADRRLRDYPHQLSGGMRQRVMIAMAIACHPSLLIADEPTTALDVTIQKQVVRLIGRLRREMGMAVIWVSHDLALIADIADRIAVFYAGTIVEEGSAAEIYRSPNHPYTKALLASAPGRAAVSERLASIGGTPPDPYARPTGCPFAPRCGMRLAKCDTIAPPLTVAANGNRVACFVASGDVA